MKVEVAYAEPARQVILSLDLPDGSTAKDAIHRSGILGQFPSISLESAAIGIFSKPCKPDHVLRDGDRVEIYRPLIADPKEARRDRAAKSSRP